MKLVFSTAVIMLVVLHPLTQCHAGHHAHKKHAHVTLLSYRLVGIKSRSSIEVSLEAARASVLRVRLCGKVEVQRARRRRR